MQTSIKGIGLKVLSTIYSKSTICGIVLGLVTLSNTAQAVCKPGTPCSPLNAKCTTQGPSGELTYKCSQVTRGGTTDLEWSWND